MHFEQNFVVGRGWFRDLLVTQNVRRTVAVIGDCFRAPGAASRLSVSTSVTDDHRALYYDGRAADDDHSVVVLIIVVRAALIVIRPATILFGLAWRHPTVAPSRLLSVIPARGALIRIAVTAVLVSVALLPSLFGTVICGVRIFFSWGLIFVRL